MRRNYLNPGDILELNKKVYTVKAVLGDGATCVVYSAEYKNENGGSYKVNIKECYPYNASISRKGTVLNWEFSDEKEKCIKAFEATYKKLNEWQEGVANVSVYDICDANNTKYIIMEHNKGCVTFDKDKPESLSDILKTVKLLSHYVGKYHHNGYLHLDVKPSNFLVYPRPSDHIVLFDLDTVAAIADIESGKCTYTSYSDGWAAPEQKQGKIYKLCPATDIYAIGAVLFEKIMGRRVNNDDIGYFAEWEFEGELFETINPKIKRLLTNIFKKTLAASVKRRYQNTDALIKDLDKAIKIAESEVYLKGADICCSGCFIGRENELRLIKESFDNKKKAVFLHGFGGIGKTELARKYSELYKKDYDVVLFLKYDKNSTLQDKITDLNIENCDIQGIEKYKKICSLLDERTLVIVDNFDVERKRGADLNDLLNTKAHILVSTRTDFSPVYNGDKYTQIEVAKLADNELEQVFLNNAQITDLNESDKDILHKIFELIENHTYATELLAKQMYYSGWSLEFLHNKIKSGFAGLENAENIVVNKDEEINEDDNSLAILRAVYCISNLSDEQKQVLRNIYLLNGFIAVTKDIYKEYCNSDLHINEGYYEWSHYKTYHYYFTPVVPDSSGDIDIINKLASLGWIQIRNDYYTLHPLMVEMVSLDLKPSKENCVKIYEYIEAKLAEFEWCNCNDSAEIRIHRNNCQLLALFLNFIDFDNEYNRELIMKFLRCIIEDSNDIILELCYNSACKSLLEKTNNHKDKISLEIKEKYEINLVLFLVNVQIFNVVLHDKSYVDIIFELYENLKCLTKELGTIETLVEKLEELLESGVIMPKSLVRQMVIDFPCLNKCVSYERKLMYGIPISEKEVVEYEEEMAYRFPKSIEISSEKTQEEKNLEDREKQINQLYKDFISAVNKLDFAKQLYKSSGMKIYEVVGCLFDFCWRVFLDLCSWFRSENAIDIDWHDIKDVIDYAENLQLSPEWEEKYYKYDVYEDDFDDNDECCVSDKIWHVKLMALLDDWDALDYYINNNKNHFYDYEFNCVGSPDALVFDVARVCYNVYKSYKIIRYLLEFVSYNEGDKNFDEREHIETFEEIIRYAKAACEEVGEDSDEYTEFLEIAQIFTERINRLTNKNYKLKSEIY